MSTIKTMTLEEVKRLPKMTEARAAEIAAFEDKFDDPDCPIQTPEQLKQFRPAFERNPDWYRVKKVDVHLKLDADVLAALKAGGKGYQTRINAILRESVQKDLQEA